MPGLTPAQVASRRRLAAALSIAALAATALFAPVPAEAAVRENVTVGIQTVNGQQHIVVDGTNRSEKVYVRLERSSPGVGYWQISASNPNFATLMTDLGPGCSRDSNPYMNYVVNCPTAGITRIDIYLYGGADGTTINMDTWFELQALRLPLYIDGGSGRDRLIGGPMDDELRGGTGNDELIGWTGKDRLFGDGDDDRLTGDTNTWLSLEDLYADVYSGGPGIDTLDEQRGFYTTNFWSMDNVANDGADLDEDLRNGPEELDNLLSDVENIYTGFGVDQEIIFGSAAANRIEAGLGNDWVSTLGGNDVVNDVGGENYYDTGAGNDEIIYSAGTIKAGPGNDKVTGSDSPDEIDPGPGIDNVNARGGNDTIKAADSTQDRVDCGPGVDFATVDTSDVLSTAKDDWCELQMGPIGITKLVVTGGTIEFAAPEAGRMEVTIEGVTTRLGRTAATVYGKGTFATTGRGKIARTVPWTTAAGKAKARNATLPAVVKLRFIKAGTTTTWASTARTVTFKR